MKLPGLFWDGNGEEFALHSHAPWHVLPSQGEEPDADQFSDDLCCWELSSAEPLNFRGLESASLCFCCSWQSSADFEGKKWLLSRLSSHGRGKGMSQTGILHSGSLPVSSTGFPYVEAVSSLLIWVFLAIFLWRYRSWESLSSKRTFS